MSMEGSVSGEEREKLEMSLYRNLSRRMSGTERPKVQVYTYILILIIYWFLGTDMDSIFAYHLIFSLFVEYTSEYENV